MDRLSRMIAWLVAACARRARSVVLVTLVAGLAAAAFTAVRFSVHTEIAALIPPEVPWRTHEAELERAFIEQGDDITVVIDGRTPEAAAAAASRLFAALAPRHDLFRRVTRLADDDYFAREGLLFLPEPEVRAFTSALIEAQPLLAPAASDPSLRGIMTGLTTASGAVAAGQAPVGKLAPLLPRLAVAAEDAKAGRPSTFSWRPLLTGQPADAEASRQLLRLFPAVDRGRIDGGASALTAVRATAAKLDIDPAHGLRLRLTGAVAMDADELATLGEATGPLAVLAFAAVAAILWRAVRSAKIVAAIVATVLIGLAITAAFGLAVYGRFNLISVAFLPLFVGLGVDFAIQFCVRYRAETQTEPDIPAALSKAGAGAGRGLALAAGATGLSLLAFLPTSYRGVSELGLTAGVGMGVAVLLSVTFLPALLTWLRAKSPAAEAGLPMLRDADRPLQAHRRAILAGAAILGVAAVAISPGIGLNFDPMRLRSAHTESVSTFLELARNPETSPDSLDMLAPNLTAARVIAAKLRAAPSVREVLTVDNLIPPDQAPKLALIADAALLLDTAVNPFDVAPPPTDAELGASLDEAARALDVLAAGPNGAPVQADARRLAAALRSLRAGDAAGRGRLQQALSGGLPEILDELRRLLAPSPVTLDTLPADLRAEWVAPDGRARVQAFPKAASQDRLGISAFVHDVQAAAPNATGSPVAVRESQDLILGAFRQAAWIAVTAIAVLLLLALRSAPAVVLTLGPVLLSAAYSTGTCVLLGQDLNLENLIALPLLVGIGVSFNIYFVVAWRSGQRSLLRSSLSRAILFSALATGAGFGALSLSQHPGTASMGVLLLISLFWTLVVTLGVLPALLGLVWRGPAADPARGPDASAGPPSVR